MLTQLSRAYSAVFDEAVKDGVLSKVALQLQNCVVERLIFFLVLQRCTTEHRIGSGPL